MLHALCAQVQAVGEVELDPLTHERTQLGVDMPNLSGARQQTPEQFYTECAVSGMATLAKAIGERPTFFRLKTGRHAKVLERDGISLRMMTVYDAVSDLERARFDVMVRNG